MNRRLFLSSLAALASTAVLDPERLIWIPGNKAISIPSPSGLFFNVDAFSVSEIGLSMKVVRSFDLEFSEKEFSWAPIWPENYAKLLGITYLTPPNKND